MKNRTLTNYQITPFLARRLGFSKAGLIRFLREEEIDIKSFKNYSEFAKFFRKYKEQYDQVEELRNQLKLFQKINKNIVEKEKKIGIRRDNIFYTTKLQLFQRLTKEELTERKNKQGLSKDAFGNYYRLRHRAIHINITNPNISEYLKERTYDYQEKRFKRLVKILIENSDINNIIKHFSKSYVDNYINMIIIVSVIKQVEPIETKIEDRFIPNDRFLFSSDSEGGFFHKFIDYKLNKNAKSFNELFDIPKCDYVLENYKANSCFLNLLVNTYHKTFSKCKRYKFNATYEDFLNLLDIDDQNDNIGLSIKKSLIFFQKFNLGICAIGAYGIIERWRPEKRNKKLSPDCLYIYVQNNHVQVINDNVKCLSEKIWISDNIISEDKKSIETKSIKNEYFIQDMSKFDYDAKYINSLDDVLEDVKNNCDEENLIRKNYVIFDGDLEKVLFDMIFSSPSYTPDICFSSGKIVSLRFKINGCIGSISTHSTIDPEQKDLSIKPEHYKAYHEKRNKVYESLITKQHLSVYNPTCIEIEKNTPIGPLCGYFSDDDTCNVDEYIGLDSRKAYTSDFIDIEYYPVYDFFDIWKPYDDHKIEDYTQYIVRCNSKQVEHIVLFPHAVSRVTGYKLNRIDYNGYKIIAYKRPSRLVNSNSQEIIKDLYNGVISDNDFEDKNYKKDIFNIVSGLLEKKCNKKSLTKIFKNRDEAYFYKNLYGGEVLCLGQDLEADTVFGECNRLYILNMKNQVDLNNGFVPIKELIYDIRSLKNYQTICKLRMNNVRCVGIKTDSILFHESDKSIVKKLFDFSDKIGCYKLELDKFLPNTKIERIQNNEPVIKDINITVHKIVDERDSNEINSVISRCKKMLLLGALPGVGKTTTACNFKCSKKLFVSPYNKLCQQLRLRGYDAITLNMLLGIGMNDELNIKMCLYDVEPYDCIVFDEIFLYNTKLLKKINNFMIDHTDKIFIATGDSCQNTPIGMETLNIPNPQEYMKDCINQLFHSHIVLKECKRLKNKEDIVKMVELKNDILDNNKDVIETFKKYGIKIISKMEDVKTNNNICFFNKRCSEVNTLIHSRVKPPKKTIKYNGVTYWTGLNLICKEHLKNKQYRLFVNYTYEITKIDDQKISLLEPVEGKTAIFPINVLSKFKLPYANTNHSVQGLTIEEEYTIFDSNTPYVNRNWVWVALTRTDKISNVTIFKHSEQDIRILTFCKKRQYFQNKINGYKNQDNRAGRKYNDEDYVDADWIRDTIIAQKHECCNCHCPFELSFDNGNVLSNITVDRVNSKLSHIKTNCKLTCIKCNCGRSNK